MHNNNKNLNCLVLLQIYTDAPYSQNLSVPNNNKNCNNFNKIYISNIQLLMMQDKQNILKSFQGKKIDESVHVARWGTINNEDSTRMIFQKYAMGSSNSQNQSISQVLPSQNMFATQQSQVHQIDTGFRKLKTNQIQKLKELKQEYEVLRNLNIEEKPSMGSLHQKAHSSSSSIHQSHSEELIATSSRHKKSSARKENMSREAQILTLEKKQLEMVINNSMRKIQELLHNEMDYKKQIHELKLQVSGRQNVDVEYETMIKTLKKNEMNQQENVEALKKQTQKNRFQIRQLNERIIALESEVMMKDQQIRVLLGEKRKSQDLIRLEKDRYFNLDIEYKKTKMEYELLEKDKNNEIARLSKQLEAVGANRTRDMELKIKRYEDDLQIKDRRYNVLLNQIQELKTRFQIQQNQLQQFRTNPKTDIDSQKIQEILVNFRENNDSATFTHQINQVINKIHEVDTHQNEYLRQQIQILKSELQGLRDNDKQLEYSNTQQYMDRISQLENILSHENWEKQDLASRLKKYQRQSQETSRKCTSYQQELKYYQQVELNLKNQIKTLKDQIKNLKDQVKTLKLKTLEPPKQTPIQPIQPIRREEPKQLAKYRQQIDQLQTELRTLRRLADQNEFKASKVSAESSFRLKMQQGEHEAAVSRIRQNYERQTKQFTKLKQEYETFKSVSQKKLLDKEQQLEVLRNKINFTSDGTKSNINNLKLQYESLLKSERERYKVEIEQLSTQLTSLTKINQKYLQESTKYVQIENELSCLRQIMRRSIHLSQGVDHLWRIKETEYQNVNEIMRQISTWGR